MKFKPLLVLLVTLGMIAACETVDPLIRDAQTSIQLLDFEEALESAEQALEENPYNALGHYYKGYALGAIADGIQPPSDRLPYYEDMREAMMMAKAIGDTMENRPSELDEIDDFIVTVWAYEHNAGAEIMTDDSARAATEEPELTAIDHFRNAIAAEPDSSISHIVIASIQYQIGEIEEATRSYENAMSHMDQPVEDDYEFLLSLYFMQNRFDDAVDLAIEAVETYPGVSLFAEFLADAYLETGQEDEARQMLRSLIENNPNNPQFRFALGTQLYRIAQDYLDEASTGYQNAYRMEGQLSDLTANERTDMESEIERVRSEAESNQQRAFELSQDAGDEIRQALEIRPDDPNGYNILGIIYQNRAALLFDKRNNIRDNELAAEVDQEARVNLEYAREYYEQAANLDPDETDYWEALFQVYTTLGMDEEAEEAMERSGMDL